MLLGRTWCLIAETLTSALHLASEWMCDNHLRLNVQETKTMLIHSVRKAHLPPLSVHLHSTSVQQVHNDALTWCEHVQYVSATVSRNLNLLRCLPWFLAEAALLLFCSYILPSFDYCDVVWVCCSNEEALLLERLQQGQSFISAAGNQLAQLGNSSVSLPCPLGETSTQPQHLYRAIRGLHLPYLKCLFTLSSATHGHHTRLASRTVSLFPSPRPT